MPNFLDNLNPSQKEAAAIINGPVLVLAGAGSGKTRTLTFRIAHMIKNGINPGQILAVTFTNKAAKEMQERLAQLLQLDPRKLAGQRFFSQTPDTNAFPLIGTFHFFCLTVLREDIETLKFKNNFVILDSNDQETLVKKIIKDSGLSVDNLKPKAVHSHISGLKNQLILPEQFKKQVSNYFEEQVLPIYEKYQQELFKNNALDFDDMLLLTVRIWQEQPELLKKYRSRFPYMLVDEYQDTNQAQYRLIQLMTKEHENLFVVGDDYQSIYGWRGANIQNILNFEKDFPKAQVVILDENYRSTQNILDAAQAVIDKNTNQKKKKLWTKNQTGSKIIQYEASDEEDEARFIAETILEKLGLGAGTVPNGAANQGAAVSERAIQAGSRPTTPGTLSLNDFAALYRLNSQSRVLEEQFLKFNIPYRIVGGIQFYQRAEIKDIIAYLKLALNPRDQLALARIINVPARALGKTTVDKLLAFCSQMNLSFQELIRLAGEAPKADKTTKNEKKGAPEETLKKNPSQAPFSPFSPAKLKQLAEFNALIEKIQTKIKELPLKDLITFVFKETGYQKMLNDGTPEGQTRLENVMELLSVAERYSELAPEEALKNFLEEVSLATSEENPGIKNNAVTLMTLHAAKGLEFKNVFIPGAEDGLLPHSRALSNPLEMEEERRLCYVGITRARENLWLINARNRRIFGQTMMSRPSRFLDDIPPKLIEKKVSAPRYFDSSDFTETDDEIWEEGEEKVIRYF